MDAANFALEFSQLLMRYTTPRKTTIEKTEDTDISKLSSGIPLSSETIIQLVQDTLSTIIPEPYVPSISIICNKTPNNDIIINTPDAPFVQRVTVNGNGIISECTDNLSNKLSPTDKKTTSPSKFNLINKGRSGTFVQDDEKNTDNTNEIFKEISADFLFEGENIPSSVRLKLDALRKSAVEFISQIDEIKTVNKECKQPPIEKSLRPIRRLSSIGHIPAGRSLLRPDQQLLKKRRSFINFQNTTPTSSRLNSTMTLSQNLSKRKSSSSTSLNVTTSTVSTKTPIIANNRSRSSLSVTGLKKSPLSDGRPAKNPKYAHIQSSIPKPTAIIKRT
ncbi:PREDICTED: uncharacterized protein LOC107072954 [Polistes dominula]|uniref:Uncharacterized protein LOC107072954 n=1 Tax=Polistes dominula TaxID=743375 RepID=A0ABM1J8J3_POLDO|nr:PREDICTED: uncharacterized protein LOC107072954 [Polistes dominula]